MLKRKLNSTFHGLAKRTLAPIAVLVAALVITYSASALAAEKDVCQMAGIPNADVIMRVPFKLVGGRVYVKARVNGRGPFWFGVDTGASGMARADTSLVSALKLPIVGTTENSGGVQTAKADMTHIDSLQVGGLIRRNLDVITRNYSSGASAKVALSGLIGRGFFAGGLLTINYPARVLSFSRARWLSPDKKNVLTYKRPFRVPVTIGDKRVEGNLDTGANVTFVVPKSLYDKIAASGLKKAGEGTLANTKIKLQRATVKGPIRISGVTYSNVEVRVSDRFPELLVGAYAFQNSVLMIDQRSKTVALCPR